MLNRITYKTLGSGAPVTSGFELQYSRSAQRARNELALVRNGFYAVRIQDLPDLKRRSLLLELQRQNPEILSCKGCTYITCRIIHPQYTVRGVVYWTEFFRAFPRITI